MANIIQEMLADDGIEIVNDLGYVVTWKGADYAALVSDPDVSVDLNEGGFMPEGDFKIKILRAAFNGGAGPFPQDREVITFDGNEYVITTPESMPASAFLELMIATHA